MQTFFRITTERRQQFGAGQDGFLRAERQPACPVLLLRPASHPTIGFLFASSDTRDVGALLIEGVPFRTAIQPVRVRATGAAVRLIDPVSGGALTEEDDGRVVLHSAGIYPNREAIQLEPMEASDITPTMSAMRAGLAAVLPANLNGPDILDAIAAGLTRDTAEFMQAVLRLLPPDQVEWLGGTLIGLPAHLARFTAAFPDDIWAREALPGLHRWLATRKGTKLQHLPPQWDFLAEAGLGGQLTTAPQMLSTAARGAVPPRRPVCVVATARNEGLYLLEWIAYHRLIGAESLFIYSNDNSDGSDDLLRALALAGEITWIDSALNVGKGAQPKAYGHAFGVLPGVLDYRWSLVIDLDEFFSFDVDRFQSLPDYIDWQETQPVDAISLNWLVYGSGGAAVWNDAPLIERFTKRLPWIDPHIKSLSRTNRCIHSHPHHAVFSPSKPPMTRSPDGTQYTSKEGMSFAATPMTEGAWISHYFLKSVEEFIWKFSRNRGDHALVRDLSPGLIDVTFVSMFVQQHQSPTMVDDRRTLRCAPHLRAEIDRLRALPNVEPAVTQIRNVYKQQMTELLRRVRSGPEFTAVDSPFPSLVQLCR